MFDGRRDDLVERVLIGRHRRAMSGARHRPWSRQTGPRRNYLDGGTGLSPALKGQKSAPNTSRTCLKRAWRSSRLTVEADAPGV